MIFNWKLRKRRHKRYDVSWEARLEIESKNFHDHIVAPIINISNSGALVHSEWMSIHNHHLAVAAQNDELNLQIYIPGSKLDSRISIKRYEYLRDENVFELGVEFKDLCLKNKEFIKQIIKKTTQNN